MSPSSSSPAESPICPTRRGRGPLRALAGRQGGAQRRSVTDVISYLSLGEFAARSGHTLNTMKSYLRKGYLPEPDAIVGRNRGWHPDTVERWIATRPRRRSTEGDTR